MDLVESLLADALSKVPATKGMEEFARRGSRIIAAHLAQVRPRSTRKAARTQPAPPTTARRRLAPVAGATRGRQPVGRRRRLVQRGDLGLRLGSFQWMVEPDPDR